MTYRGPRPSTRMRSSVLGLRRKRSAHSRVVSSTAHSVGTALFCRQSPVSPIGRCMFGLRRSVGMETISTNYICSHYCSKLQIAEGGNAGNRGHSRADSSISRKSDRNTVLAGWGVDVDNDRRCSMTNLMTFAARERSNSINSLSWNWNEPWRGILASGGATSCDQ